MALTATERAWSADIEVTEAHDKYAALNFIDIIGTIMSYSLEFGNSIKKSHLYDILHK